MITTRHRVRALSALVIGSLAFTACSGSGSERTGGPPPTLGSAPDAGTAPTTATATGISPLPEVDVQDVATGERRPLASLLPADTPLLVWFWAPH